MYWPIPPWLTWFVGGAIFMAGIMALVVVML